ncbi:TPA: flagellar biosynthetic protein FliO [Candidatus Sumerlaeota bacterium]|jgi:flagellar protein FliO/FliZ|nr:flagellar biosynthetic protein FliO [Candidatus Sumerlaeota bacterium]
MLPRTITLSRNLFLLLLFLVLTTLSFAAQEPATGKGTDILGNLSGVGTSASDTATGKLPATDNPGILLAKMLFSLVLVLGLIIAAAWAARRFLPKNVATGGKSDAIRIVATKMLGGRRSLVLVRVRGQTLLLGMTPQNITTLTEIHEVEGEWAQPTAGTETPATSTFNRRLGHLIEETIKDEEKG